MLECGNCLAIDDAHRVELVTAAGDSTRRASGSVMVFTARGGSRAMRRSAGTSRIV